MEELHLEKNKVNNAVYTVFQVWINAGDIILLGLRDYQDTKADVILRYNPDEARSLKAYGELPESGTEKCFEPKRCLSSLAVLLVPFLSNFLEMEGL